MKKIPPNILEAIRNYLAQEQHLHKKAMQAHNLAVGLIHEYCALAQIDPDTVIFDPDTGVLKENKNATSES